MGFKTYVKQFLVNRVLLLEYLRMQLREKGRGGLFREMNCRIAVFPDFTKHGGFSRAVGAHQGHLFSLMHRKGYLLQQFFLKCQRVVFQTEQFLCFFGNIHLRQANFRLTDLHKGCLYLPADKPVQIADLAFQSAAVLSFCRFCGYIANSVYKLGNSLDFLFIGHRGQLKVNLFLQTEIVVLRKVSLKLLQIGIFQMPNAIKTVRQQITAVGNHQHGAFIFVDQIPQTVQVFKIKENIRLVHYQQARAAQHLADNLKQLQFAAAEFFQLQSFLAVKLCQSQLLADVDLIIVSINGLSLIQQLLIALHHCFQIIAGLHLHAYLGNRLLKLKKILTQVVINAYRLVSLTNGKLAHITDPACAVQLYFSIIGILLRLADQVCQGSLSGSVAADEGAVAVLFQSKRDFLKQGSAAKSKSQFFGFYH